MKSFAAAIAVLLTPPELGAEIIGPIAARVCIAGPGDVPDILSRPVKRREDATLCVTLVPCSKAELVIRESQQAKTAHYLSKSQDSCK